MVVVVVQSLGDVADGQFKADVRVVVRAEERQAAAVIVGEKFLSHAVVGVHHLQQEVTA